MPWNSIAVLCEIQDRIDQIRSRMDVINPQFKYIGIARLDGRLCACACSEFHTVELIACTACRTESLAVQILLRVSRIILEVHAGSITSLVGLGKHRLAVYLILHVDRRAVYPVRQASDRKQRSHHPVRRIHADPLEHLDLIELRALLDRIDLRDDLVDLVLDLLSVRRTVRAV